MGFVRGRNEKWVGLIKGCIRKARTFSRVARPWEGWRPVAEKRKAVEYLLIFHLLKIRLALTVLDGLPEGCVWPGLEASTPLSHTHTYLSSTCT